jgi:regulator of replication initiation timing
MTDPTTCKKSIDILGGSSLAYTRKKQAGGLAYKGKLLVDWEAENAQLRAENGILHRRIDEVVAEKTLAMKDRDKWKDDWRTTNDALAEALDTINRVGMFVDREIAKIPTVLRGDNEAIIYEHLRLLLEPVAGVKGEMP